MNREEQEELESARTAAKVFCERFKFPARKILQLDAPPLFEPELLVREGRSAMAYRWLGGGRGGYYVQVEVYQDNKQIVVYGGYSHREFGPFNGGSTRT